MSYQKVRARYEITFEDSASAAKFMNRLSEKKFNGIKKDSETFRILSSFETDMTKEKEKETREGKNPYNIVEVLFEYDFDVCCIFGTEGGRWTPPEPDELDGYQEEDDIERHLKIALEACGVKHDYIEINNLEYESPSYTSMMEEFLYHREFEYDVEY